MENLCKRCSSPYQREVANSETFLVSAEVKSYIMHSYDGCLCNKCIHEIITYFSASSINPIYEKKINKSRIHVEEFSE